MPSGGCDADGGCSGCIAQRQRRSGASSHVARLSSRVDPRGTRWKGEATLYTSANSHAALVRLRTTRREKCADADQKPSEQPWQKGSPRLCACAPSSSSRSPLLCLSVSVSVSLSLSFSSFPFPFLSFSFLCARRLSSLCHVLLAALLCCFLPDSDPFRKVHAHKTAPTKPVQHNRATCKRMQKNAETEHENESERGESRKRHKLESRGDENHEKSDGETT